MTTITDTSAAAAYLGLIDFECACLTWEEHLTGCAGVAPALGGRESSEPGAASVVWDCEARDCAERSCGMRSEKGVLTVIWTAIHEAGTGGVVFLGHFEGLRELRHDRTQRTEADQWGPSFVQVLENAPVVSIRLDVSSIQAQVRRALFSKRGQSKAGAVRVKVSRPLWKRLPLDPVEGGTNA